MAIELNNWVRIVSEEAARREGLYPNDFGQIVCLSSPSANPVTARCEDRKLHRFRSAELEAVAETEVPADVRVTILEERKAIARSAALGTFKVKNAAQRAGRSQERPWQPSTSPPAPLVGTLKCRRCGHPWPVPADVAASGAPFTCRTCDYKLDKLGRKRRPRARKKALGPDESPRPLPGMTTGPCTAPVHIETVIREYRTRRRRAKWAEDRVLDAARDFGYIDVEEAFILRRWKIGIPYQKISYELGALAIPCSKSNVANLVEKALAKLKRRWRAALRSGKAPRRILEISAVHGLGALATTEQSSDKAAGNALTDSLYESTTDTKGLLSDLDSGTGIGSTNDLIEGHPDDLDSEGEDALIGLDRDSPKEDLPKKE